MKTDPVLEDLALWRLFFKIAETGSFLEAAIAFGRPASWATRALKKLETAVGEPLFDRSARPARLTAKGKEVRSRMQAPFLAFESSLAKLKAHEKDTAFVLRVSGATGFLRHFISPFLAGPLQEIDPLAVARVASGMTETDVLAGRCDILVSPAPSRDPRLGSYPVVSATTVPLASPKYLEARGVPRTPADLARHSGLLRSSSLFPSSQMLWREGEGFPVEWQWTCEYSDMDSIREAAAAGLGISVDLPVSMAVDAIRNGELVPVLRGWMREPWNYSAYFLKDSPNAARIEPIALWLSGSAARLIASRREEAMAVIRKAWAAESEGA